MGLRILIVDDSTTIQKIFKIALSRYAVETVTANSFVEAINEMVRQPPTVVVIDANLHGLRQPSDWKKLQDQAQDAPFLLLVGTHEPFAAEDFASSGLNYHLRKPFEAQDIVRSLTQILGSDIPLKETAQVQHQHQNQHQQQSHPVIALDLDRGMSQYEQMNPRMTMPLPQDMDAALMAPPPPPPSHLPPPPPGLAAFGGQADAKIGLQVAAQQKGRKAFGDPPSHSGYNFASATDDMPETVIAKFDPTPPPAPSWSEDDAFAKTPPLPVSSMAPPQANLADGQLAEFLRGEAQIVVRKAVEKYCEQHFAQLARDVLTAELRRLAEEKSRLLSN